MKLRRIDFLGTTAILIMKDGLYLDIVNIKERGDRDATHAIVFLKIPPINLATITKTYKYMNTLYWMCNFRLLN